MICVQGSREPYEYFSILFYLWYCTLNLELSHWANGTVSYSLLYFVIGSCYVSKLPSPGSKLSSSCPDLPESWGRTVCYRAWLSFHINQFKGSHRKLLIADFQLQNLITFYTILTLFSMCLVHFDHMHTFIASFIPSPKL